VVVAGMVVSVRHNKTQKGSMGSVLLDDRTGRIEATFFSEAYEHSRERLNADQILVINGQLGYDDYRGGWSLRAEHAHTIEEIRALRATRLLVEVNAMDLRDRSISAEGLQDRLRAMLAPFCGGMCRLVLDVKTTGVGGQVLLGKQWLVTPADELLNNLQQLFGKGAIQVEYGQQPAAH
jgi:DNA polymerase-3 subunit alpha